MILYITDDLHFYRITVEVLEEAGHQVLHASGTEDFDEQINREEPDLLLLDTTLQGTRGFGLDTLQGIRESFYDLPIILLSSYDELKEDMRSIAADFYVVKSEDLDELKLKITLATDERYRITDHLYESELERKRLDKDTISKNKIVVVTQFVNEVLMRQLDKNPERMLSLNPRQFEEFVAELFARDGFEVELTPLRKDGGRDILAVSKSDFGSHLYLAECKRYNPNRPVGVEYIRSLYGVLELEKATKGIIATTSYFTKGATHLARDLKWRITLKDYDDLMDWIRKYGACG